VNVDNVTPARARALEQLHRHGRVRVGVGMYDDTKPVVTPAGETWLLAAGHAHHDGDGWLIPATKEDATT
jgi:hypothetical protein